MAREILYTRMTNPDAYCGEVGMGMGRTSNMVDICWRTTTAATSVDEAVCAAYAASQPVRHGPFAVAPTKFVGRLKQIEVIYPHGPVATPKTNYDMKLHRGGALKTACLAASAFLNIPIKAASQKTTQIKIFNPPVEINGDIFLNIWNTGATRGRDNSKYQKQGKLRLYFE